MLKTRSARFVFVIVVAALLLIVGRNVFRHQREQALMDAVNSNDEDASVALLQQGTSAYDARSLEWLLGEAIMQNERRVIGLLLEGHVNPNTNAYNGLLPLNLAVKNCPGVVGLLLDKGADPNAQDNMGSTALVTAAGISRPDSAELLLNHGADVNLTSRSGASPLGEAVSADSNETIRRLTVRLLLAAKPNLTIKNKALGTAVRTGKADMVRILLAAGAYPAPQSPEWLRAVSAARSMSHSRQMDYSQVFLLLRPLGITDTPDKAEIEAKHTQALTLLQQAIEKIDQKK